MRLDLKPSKELRFISSIPVKSLLMLAIRDNKAKAKGCSPEWFETQWVRKVCSPLDAKILGHRQVGKAQDFDSCIFDGSSPSAPAILLWRRRQVG